MADNAKKNKPDENAGDKVSFEEAIEKLEQIIVEMENEEIPLEKVIEKYEEGIKLVKICQQRLSEAELKVQELEKKIGGEFSLKSINFNNEKDES
jgi:exodeoxyribonuclease VII small subunit